MRGRRRRDRHEIVTVARGWRWGRPAPRPPRATGEPVRSGAAFDTDWARSEGWNTVRAVVQEAILLPAVRLLTSPTIRGRERLASVEQPAIVVANHASHLDTGVVIAALPSPWRHKLAVGAAADYFFRDRMRGNAAALALAAFPIERTRASVTSARLALDLVAQGWNLILFPEGGRSEDGWLQELKPGAAFVAAKTGRPVVPMWIAGTDRILPKGAGRPKRGKVEVIVGDPIHPLPGETPRALHARMDEAMRRLGLEAASDWWSALRAPVADVGGPQGARWRRVWSRTEPVREGPRWP